MPAIISITRFMTRKMTKNTAFVENELLCQLIKKSQKM
jgi:hypothetical protein